MNLWSLLLAVASGIKELDKGHRARKEGDSTGVRNLFTRQRSKPILLIFDLLAPYHQFRTCHGKSMYSSWICRSSTGRPQIREIRNQTLMKDDSNSRQAQRVGSSDIMASSIVAELEHIQLHPVRVAVTLGSPGYGQGPLGLADIRSATRLPPQPPGPPGVPLMIWGQWSWCSS